MDIEIKRAVQEFLKDWLEASEAIRKGARRETNVMVQAAVAEGASVADLGGEIFAERQESRESMLKSAQTLELQQAVGLESESAVFATDTIIEEYGLDIELGTVAYAEMVSEVTKQLTTFWKTQAERAVGNYDNPYDLAVRVPEIDFEEDKPLLSELIEKYIETRHKVQKESVSQNVKTVNGYRAMLKLFIRIIGDRPANRLAIDDIDEYLKILQQLPSNLNKSSLYKGMTIAEILDMDDVEPMAGKTIKNNLRQAKSFCKWLYERDYLSKDVAASHSYTPDDTRKDSEERKVYERDDIQGMVNGFISERSAQTRRFMARPERFWVPILSLFGGFRLEEVCQLLVADITEVTEIWCVDCNWYDGRGKKVKKFKNKNATRVQPLHQTVLDLGFMSYVRAMRDAGHERLFPLLTPRPSDNGKLGGNLSAWYNGQKGSYKGFENQYVDTDPDKAFHSLRHSFCTAVEHPGMSDRMLSDLMGHAKETTASKRYTKEQAASLKLVEIERIDYGVDFVGQLGHWDDWH